MNEVSSIGQVATTLGFLCSVIKSGESWTSTCEAEAKAAHDALHQVARIIAGEREAREKADAVLRQKDHAMSVLFQRATAAGIDWSDLIP